MYADKGCIRSKDISFIFYLRRTWPDKKIVIEDGTIDTKDKTALDLLIEKWKNGHFQRSTNVPDSECVDLNTSHCS